MRRENSNRPAETTADHGQDLGLAIANLANAVEQYCAEQPGTIRRFPFVPSPTEREAVRRLIAKGKSNRDWNAAINVDLLEGRNTRWIRVEMPSSAEFVGRFTCPNSPSPAFQGDFENLEISELRT